LCARRIPYRMPFSTHSLTMLYVRGFIGFIVLWFQNGFANSRRFSSAIKTCLTALTNCLAHSLDVNPESSSSKQ
jgi:hypothetical protein